uniref:Uncharacterized protein n=1 Tax=Arundo donax TaxID=35708 RepID=A0A0A9HIX5_ARUDO
MNFLALNMYTTILTNGEIHKHMKKNPRLI